ncbi:MAG: GGDEF domain-containing protein [Campylobacterota bacterium]|nr:GGDEF domain-containing protein [Campylobacterota bacterium]
MNSMMNTLIELQNSNQPISSELHNIIELNDQLNALSCTQEYCQILFNWLNRTYNIHTFKILTFDVEKNLRNIVFHKGAEFNELNNSNLIQYTQSIFSYKNSQVFIEADNEDHMEILANQKSLFDFLFYLIQPSLRAMIIQKNYEEVQTIDHVTGLYNRNYLLEHLRKLLPLAQREHKQVGFLMVGIDHFKAVIDEFDYNIGDKVLIELAKDLEKNVRTSDLVIRLDSDEFLIVLSNINSIEDTINVAHKLISSFASCEVNVNAYTNQTLKKTICVGATIYPDDSTSVDQLLKNTDIALYEARNNGRSQALLYTKEEESSIDLF